MPSSASATIAIYTLSLHDALPISGAEGFRVRVPRGHPQVAPHFGQFLLRDAKQVDALAAGDLHHRHLVALGHLRDALQLGRRGDSRSEEHTSELQSPMYLVCRLLLRRPSRSTLFPYTTLFRSQVRKAFVYACPEGIPRSRHTSGSFSLEMPSRSMRWPPVIFTIGTWWRSATSAMRFSSAGVVTPDRKSTRLNSSHRCISYAVFCFGDHRDLHSFPTRRSSDLRCGRLSCTRAPRASPGRATLRAVSP